MDAPRPPLSVGGFMAQIGDCWHFTCRTVFDGDSRPISMAKLVAYDVAGVAITRGGRGECIIDGCIVVIGGDRRR